MKLSSSEPKNITLNIRCNKAERQMINSLCTKIRPRVSASKLILWLCEEKAKELDVISIDKNGEWTIEE